MEGVCSQLPHTVKCKRSEPSLLDVKLLQQLERLAAMPDTQLQRTLDDMPTNRLVLLAKVGECSRRPEFKPVVDAMAQRLDKAWNEVSVVLADAQKLIACIQLSAVPLRGGRQYA